jgi:hypothetical protein
MFKNKLLPNAGKTKSKSSEEEVSNWHHSHFIENFQIKWTDYGWIQKITWSI